MRARSVFKREETPAQLFVMGTRMGRLSAASPGLHISGYAGAWTSTETPAAPCQPQPATSSATPFQNMHTVTNGHPARCHRGVTTYSRCCQLPAQRTSRPHLLFMFPGSFVSVTVPLGMPVVVLNAGLSLVTHTAIVQETCTCELTRARQAMSRSGDGRQSHLSARSLAFSRNILSPENS